MEVYILLFMVLLIVGMLIFNNGYTNNTKKLYCGFFWLCIVLIECFRDVSVGEDTINYVAWFEDFCADGWKKSFINPPRYVEPGFKILNLLVAEFTNNYHIFIAVISIIIVSLFVFFLEKNSDDIFLSSMLFFGFNFFINSMTAWRQFISMGIVFWLLPLLLRKEWCKSFLVGILAFSFHRSSSIYMLVALCMLWVKNDRRIIKLVVIGEGIILVILPDVLRVFLWLQPKYDIYFKYGETAAMGKLRIVYIIVESLTLIYYYCRKDIHSRMNHCIAIMVSISAWVGILNAYIPHIFRLGYYFDFYMLLFVPILIPKRLLINKVIWKFGTVLFSFSLFVYYLYTNAGGVVPYKIF